VEDRPQEDVEDDRTRRDQQQLPRSQRPGRRGRGERYAAPRPAGSGPGRQREQSETRAVRAGSRRSRSARGSPGGRCRRPAQPAGCALDGVWIMPNSEPLICAAMSVTLYVVPATTTESPKILRSRWQITSRPPEDRYLISSPARAAATTGHQSDHTQHEQHSDADDQGPGRVRLVLDGRDDRREGVCQNGRDHEWPDNARPARGERTTTPSASSRPRPPNQF